MMKLLKHEIEIVPAEQAHVYELVKNMRLKDKIEVQKLGATPEYATQYSFDNGVNNKTALYNGHVIAMWGVGGSYLAEVGNPWLLTTTYSEDVSPVTFAKVYRKEVQEMLSFFSVLINYVDVEYEEAIRLLKICGFKIDNKQIDTGHGYFYKFSIGEQNENY